jgi:hypothetical protein
MTSAIAFPVLLRKLIVVGGGGGSLLDWLSFLVL